MLIRKLCCLHTIRGTIKFWFIKHIILQIILQNTIPEAFFLTLRFHTGPLPNSNSFTIMQNKICIRIFRFSTKSLFIGVFWHKGRYEVEFACVNYFWITFIDIYEFIQGCVLRIWSLAYIITFWLNKLN